MSAQAPLPLPVAAYCDVDGTLTDTNIVTPLVWMKKRCLPAPLRQLWMAALAVRLPWWWTVDQLSRRASNLAIYSHYRGVSASLVRGQAETYYREKIRPAAFAGAVARLKEFQRDGVRVVLVTGGLDVFMMPMAREFSADCLAPRLEESNGAYTGRLTSTPFTGEEKALQVRAHAAAHGIDLDSSYALGDAFGDLQMLECVGRPVAVNPDKRLAKIAADRGWQLERWR
jgi:HAD superfamily hydrolase (TIGR01490 family)